MTITLLDVFILTRLPILEDDMVCLIEEPFITPRHHDSYSSLINEVRHGEPTFDEHVNFLLILLCKYIFYPTSAKPTIEYLPSAYTLAEGKHYALSSILLGNLYFNLRRCLKEPFRYINGGVWLLQIWLFAYFPIFHDNSEAPLPAHSLDPGCDLITRVYSRRHWEVYKHLLALKPKERLSYLYKDFNGRPKWLHLSLDSLVDVIETQIFY